MFNSLRARLGLLFAAFLLLVIASVAVTFTAVESQRHDALLINLAGRQRMLAQRLTWLALTAPDDPALAADRQRFVQTFTALAAGGPTLDSDGQPVTLPPPTDPAVQATLDGAWQGWLEFAALIDRATAVTPPAAGAVTELAAAARALTDRLDRTAALLTAAAQARAQRLLMVQAIFLLLALSLLWVGHRFTRRHVVNPLAELGAAAQAMAAGQLKQTLPAFPTAELQRLAAALESVRVEVLAGHRRLETQVSQRTQELTTAFQFSQEIVAQLELAALLESVTARARTLMAGTAAALCLLDDQQATLRLAAGSGNGQVQADLRQPVDADLPTHVIGRGRTVVSNTACTSCGFLRSLEGGECIATPLRAGDATLGALCVVRPAEATFEAEEQAALTLLANATAVAIVNARLVEAGRLQAQVAAVHDERERIAGELHDHLAQTLSFLSLKADRLEELIAAGADGEAGRELAQMRGATARAYGQVRAALTGLHTEPHSATLAQSLRACVEEVGAATGLPVKLEVDDDALALAPLAQQQVVHIVREALTNAWRHAAAQHVTVRARRVGDSVQFTVADDGCGFDPAAVDETAHLGLAIMRARAERSGGRLAVHSQPGVGTQVVVSFPCSLSEV